MNLSGRETTSRLSICLWLPPSETEYISVRFILTELFEAKRSQLYQAKPANLADIIDILIRIASVLAAAGGAYRDTAKTTSKYWRASNTMEGINIVDCTKFSLET